MPRFVFVYLLVFLFFFVNYLLNVRLIWFDCLIWLCLYRIIYICISMSGQLDGNFLPGSRPHKFILIVTLIICFVVNKFFPLSACARA